MRLHFASAGTQATLDSLKDAFVPVADKFGMRWELRRHATKRRVLVMVSKFGHCLNDLLPHPPARWPRHHQLGRRWLRDLPS